MRTRPWNVAGLILLCGAVACSEAGTPPDGWIGSIDTLPNGAVVIRNEAAASPGTNAWRLEETTRIGRLEGDGPDAFGMIAGLAVDALGRVYVLDRHKQEISVFDAEGRLVRAFGQPGEGPGELTDANGVQYDSDGRIWVSDMRAAAYVAFDTTGAFLRTVGRRLNSVGFLWDAEFVSNGKLVESDSRPAVNGPAQPILVVFDLDGREAVATDTFPAPRNPKPLPPFTLEANGRTMMAAAVPFAPVLTRTVGPDGSLWFGVTNRYRIHARRMEGDTVRIVERRYDPVPVTEADVADALETRLRAFVEAGGHIDRSRIPRAKPIYDQLAVDPYGNLWVRLVGDARDGPETRWDIFAAEGHYLGVLRIPVKAASWTRPVITEDALWLVAEDELDVPYVIRYAVARD